MIKSRELAKGQELQRDKEVLKVIDVTKRGNSHIAVVTNSKGKKEELTITHLWERKVKIISGHKKELPAIAKVKKEKNEEVKKKTKTERKGNNKLVMFRRGQGICTILYENGELKHSSWIRKPIEKAA